MTFKVGTDLDVAQVQVQNRVAIAQPQLPEEVQRKASSREERPDILMVVFMLSPDDSLDQLFISNYVLLQVSDQMLRLDGVGDIKIFGVRDYSMRLWLDPDKIAARHDRGRRRQRSESRTSRSRRAVVGGPPLPKESAAFQYTLNAQGRLTDPSEFGDIVVKVGSDGRITRLKDIGRVELGGADYGTTVDYCTGIPPSRWPFSSYRAPMRSTLPT